MNRSPAWSRVALFAILVLDVWWRCHTIGPTIRELSGFSFYPVVQGEAEPLDCDEAAYAYIGRGLANGAVMYRDYSENKPPLGYWLYAATVKIGGANELTVRLMPIPFVMGTIALVWWIGSRLRGPASGCVAAFLYVLLSTDPYLFGNGANMEHFINLFAVASLAAVVRWFEGRDRRWLVAAGACVALATLVKQVAALHGLIYVAAACLAHREATSGRVGQVIQDGMALALGFAGPVGFAVGVLWAQGALADAYADVIEYGSALASIKVPEPNAPWKIVRWFTGNADPNGLLPPPFGRTRYLVWWGVGSWPTWLAAMPAVGWLLAGRSTGPRRLVAAWTLGCWVQVALPGLFWQHYYLLPTPGLALVVAVALGDAFGSIRRREVAGMLAGSMLLAALGWTVRIQVGDYLLVAPEQLTARYKGGQQWIALRSIGRELGRRSASWPGASLYVWGWQSPLFIYANLDGPTRHFFADPLLEDYSRGHHREDARVRPRAERIVRDLEAHPPSIAFVAYPPFPPLRKFLEDRYVRSRMLGMSTTSRDDMGLWIAREHHRAFEAATGEAR